MMPAAAAVPASRLERFIEWGAPQLERIIDVAAPRWALLRAQARAAVAAVRHYEAATPGRQTNGWRRSSTDANSANRPAIQRLRDLARELYRNNGWARRGTSVICNNTVGWGIQPAPAEGVAKKRSKAARTAWKSWAETTACDADGIMTFGKIQRLVMTTVVKAGECLVVRRWRLGDDDLPLPMQLQVLEPDYLDSYKDGIRLDGGGRIIQGVEFDARGRRVAYWLYDEHPGSIHQIRGTYFGASKRVPAADVLHVFMVERPGQVRGVSWFAPAIVAIQELDEYESAALMKQKIAACFSAFVVDNSGTSPALSKQSATDPLAETLEPGTISYLGPNRTVTFSNPPNESNYDPFTKAQLRRVAAGFGVTYEDLTGDYPHSFSASRLGRLSHWGNVWAWQHLMVIPGLCDPVWRWFCEAAVVAGLIDQVVEAQWSPPPMPMIEPDKEGLAYTRLMRSGVMTLQQAVGEQGRDFESHLDEYASTLKALDDKGIWLDSDPRRTSAAGLTQERGTSGGSKVTTAAEGAAALGGDE